MRTNLPVTQNEREFPEDCALVSTTDAQGRITHCNHHFVDISGFDYEELIGQPHNIVRHPDMPTEAFKDMWGTIGRGRPWSGVVKNRCKNGDFYWVLANVTPVLANGKPVAYMSVRLKPSRAQIAQAEALYERLRRQREDTRSRIHLHAGGVRRYGLADLPQRIHRLSLTQRLLAGLAGVVVAGVLPGALGLGVAAQALALGATATALAAWFHVTVERKLRRCTELAAQIAGCRLAGQAEYDMRHPLGKLMRNVWLTGLNMRAIVEDVRGEVRDIASAASEVAAGSRDLAQRSEEQSASVQQTASAVDEINATVHRTAEAAQQVAKVGESTLSTAERGGAAMSELAQTMQGIDRSSRQVHEVIQVVESIAFQTNILSLNAAVEAARAGEHGRGFAIVAAEVRALAQRVTSAAKEIGGLATGAVEQAAQGGKRMTQSNAVIGDVVNSVNHVDRLIREIAQVAHEQRAGVDHIGEAMARIDQTSQQNAALAEQASAACDTMHARTATLQRAVQIFDLAR
ncbi:MAG: chemotaxis protein [Rubrivivax sp. SCN 71-131]|jgi:aerotaxis receptor|nr:MAG: chemotaxis protein [Rubrivivax sp. SCN 71-131]